MPNSKKIQLPPSQDTPQRGTYLGPRSPGAYPASAMQKVRGIVAFAPGRRPGPRAAGRIMLISYATRSLSNRLICTGSN